MNLACFLKMCQDKKNSLLCGDFTYWLDTPASKPCTGEFCLLNVSNVKNFVMMPTHVSGHTLDLVLVPTESDFVGGIEISLIDSDISDHALLTFTLCFSKPPTYRKTITFRNYSGLDANVAANIIKTDLVDAVAQGQTSVQRTNSYNEVFSSARDQFCPLVTKDIIIKDDAPWYDHSMVSLCRQPRKAEREWRRLRTDSSRTVYIAAQRAVVKQIFVCKVEYYQHQLALTTGDHRRTFQLLNNLLGKVHFLKLSLQLVSLPSLTPKLTVSEVILICLCSRSRVLC